MKRNLRSILSLVFVALLVGTSFIAAFAEETTSSHYTLTIEPSTNDGKYFVDTQGKTDVIAYIPSYFNSPKYGNDYQDQTHVYKLTDGIYAIEPLKDLYGISYFNLAWCTKDEQTDRVNAGGEVEYKLTTGETGKYMYSHEWKELDVNVNSFALWFNNETAYYDYETKKTYDINQMDMQFQILVSQDGGKTYSIAYESVPYSRDDNAITGNAAWLKSEGGEWEMIDAIDKDKSSLFRYRYCTGEFSMEFKNVTNIVYACVYPRPSGTFPKFFYYSGRFSEIDVYGTINSTKYDQSGTTEAPETTASPETKAPATTAEVKTEAPVITTAEPKTEAPVVTTAAPETQAQETKAPETEAPAKSGCDSSAACLSIAVMSVLGTALIKKKD